MLCSSSSIEYAMATRKMRITYWTSGFAKQNPEGSSLDMEAIYADEGLFGYGCCLLLSSRSVHNKEKQSVGRLHELAVQMTSTAVIAFTPSQ